MKSNSVPVLLICAATLYNTQAQPVISSSDLFNQPGLYYRAHANEYDPTDISGSTAYTVPSGLIGTAGPDNFWDFSNGPEDRLLRFDYMEPDGLPEAEPFEDATIVERMTNEGDNSVQYLFFEQAPAGRVVYGYHAENSLFTPSNVFVPPIIDFPATISYGQEWNTSTTYINTLRLDDPDPEEGGQYEVAQRTTLTSTFKVDAHGTIVLPDELDAFGPGLRINEEVVIDVAVALEEGQFEHFATYYTRNYYWVMPGYGIVAQLNSTQGDSPQPENFSRATAFIRMFDTNKDTSTGGGCTDPDPVSDVRIRVNNDVVLLTWTKAACATRYQVEYCTEDLTSWEPLGNPTENAFWQGESINNGTARFYRIVSLK